MTVATAPESATDDLRALEEIGTYAARRDALWDQFFQLYRGGASSELNADEAMRLLAEAGLAFLLD